MINADVYVDGKINGKDATVIAGDEKLVEEIYKKLLKFSLLIVTVILNQDCL